MADSPNALRTVEEELNKRTGSSKEKDLADKVRGWFNQAKDARSAKDQKFLSQYKIYRFTGDRPKFPWRSDIYVPMGHVNVQVKTAKMVTAILSSDPFFRARARSGRFAQSEDVVEQLMLQQLEEMGWPKILHGWVLGHYIFGTGILKGYWKYEEIEEEYEEIEYRPVYVKLGGETWQTGEEPVTVKRTRTKVVYDGPAFEVVNIFDFYPDPQATSIKSARYVIHRREVSIDHLKAMAKKGVYKKSAVNKIAAMRSEASTDSSQKVEIDGIEDEALGKETHPGIEILECFTPTRKIVIGPSNVLLQTGKNKFPRIPFFDLPHLPSPHRLFGIATNEPVASIQKAVNKVHRLRFDNWLIQVHKMFVVSEDALRSPSDVVARPGAIIRVKGGRDIDNSIKELVKQPLPMESYMEQDTLERLNETITGVNEPAKGIERRSGKSETATKTRMTAQGTSIRFGVELVLIEPVIKEVLEFMHSLNQTFLTVPRVIRVMGEQGRQYPLIGADHIQGEFDFKFELAPVQGNKEEWLQRLMLIFQQYAQNPLIAPLTNWMEFAKRLAKAADLRNPEMLFGPQYLQQNMLLQMGPPQPGPGGEGGPATNPQAGAMNAKMRSPQPTPKDAYRDIFARVG